MADRLPVIQPEKTEVGSYFVATYPPFSVWSAEAVARDAMPALHAPPQPGVPLGLYVHIPFCRKRCHFCYFRVYTDKNAQEVQDYLDVVAREWELWRELPAVAGRPLGFVYFGGGTPSFLSTRQLESLVERLVARRAWTQAEEVTFECEPGTLTEAKLAVIRRLGVTRLSLGVENFSDDLLELNGRAHRSPEIRRAYDYARSLDFPQINIDLIAGMLGETDDNWRACIREDAGAAARQRDHLPDGAAVQHHDQQRRPEGHGPVHAERGRLGDQAAVGAGGLRGAGGPGVSRAQRLHRGEGSRAHAVRLHRSPVAGRRHDRPGRGVVRARQPRPHAEPGHLGNLRGGGACRRGAPVRAYRPSDDERLIRELILQLKRGSIAPGYFQGKYAVDVRSRFRSEFESLAAEGYLSAATDQVVALTRDGLLRVDSLLKRFFLPAAPFGAVYT